MKQAIDSPRGRKLYSQRMATKAENAANFSHVFKFKNPYPSGPSDPARGDGNRVLVQPSWAANSNKEDIRVDESMFLRALTPYFKAFAEHDQTARLLLLQRAMTPDAEIWGPLRLFAGYQQISEKISGFHQNSLGCRLVLATGLNTFLNSARIGCAILGPKGEIRARGEALIELAPDGRIQRVIPFWEALPPLPTAWLSEFAVSSQGNSAA